jgi:hypothetical protein
MVEAYFSRFSSIFQLISTQVAVIHMSAANQWPEKGDTCAKYFSARLWPWKQREKCDDLNERMFVFLQSCPPSRPSTGGLRETGCFCNVVRRLENGLLNQNYRILVVGPQ